MTRRSAFVAIVVALVALSACEPSSDHQYEDVQRLGGLRAGADSLDTFTQVRASSHWRDGVFWYLDWRSDGCSSPMGGLLNNQNGVPMVLSCRRHDFNWSNLYQVERYGSPLIETWNGRTKDQADVRFRSDNYDLCVKHLPWWNPDRIDCISVGYSASVAVGMVPFHEIRYDHHNGL